VRGRFVPAALLLSISLAPQQAPPRDVRRPVAAGGARIVGTVRTAESPARPLRRARVMLNGDALPIGRTAIVDDAGVFAFDGLPAGRYTLTATKEGYVTMAFGARRPERPGRSIPLRSGESQTVDMRLPRGAVITGTLTDAAGERAPGITVGALTLRYMAASGERRSVTAATAVTDDRGIYRIFGLAAGEYLVEGVPYMPVNDVQVLSDAEVKRALSSLRESGVFRSKPGIQPAPAALPPAEPRKSVALAPVFYPGTTVSDRARTIELVAGEERAAVDFALDYVPTATVSGLVSEGASITLLPSPQSSISINNVRGTRAGVDGRFTFASIPPGEYIVIARGYPPTARVTSTGPPPLAEAAQTQIVVTGDDIAGVSLLLQPGVTLRGRLVFDGAARPPLDVPVLRLAVPAYMPLGPTMQPMPALELRGDGRFSVAGIVPGSYRVASNAPGLRTPFAGWWLKSITVGGRELLDASIDVREDHDDAVVTFSDRASELSGRVGDARGNAWADGYVVVFSVDRDKWFFNSRRIAGAHPNSEGRYVIRNLPPGEYFVAAYDDILVNEWFDPTLLAQLAPRAARIRLDEYELKTYDIMVR
jgi:hypothetical protein